MSQLWIMLALLMGLAVVVICWPIVSVYFKRPANMPRVKDYWLGSATLIAFIFVSFGLYAQLGESEALARKQLTDQMPQVETLIVQLQQQVEKKPSDTQALYFLAKSYMAVEEYGLAATVFDQTSAIVGPNAELLALQAQATFYAQGLKPSAQVDALLAKSIAIEPDQATALSMLGFMAFHSENYAEAIIQWQRLVDAHSNENESDTSTINLDLVKQAIQDSRERLNQSVTKGLTVDGKQQELLEQRQVNLLVTIDEGLRARVSDADTIFIYAQTLTGPKVPLAAIKISAKELPITVALDDSNRMVVSNKLSNHSNVQVWATVNFSDVPGLQSGDLYGHISSVNTDEKGTISLMISEIKP
jgi:cytochrome c-type biogenesis protein CcmH